MQRRVLPTVLVGLLALLLSSAVSAQYYTASVSSTAPFNTATNPPVTQTIEPTCLQDYRAVWTQNPVAPMWSVSGGSSYVYDTPYQAFYSTNGFSSVTASAPGTVSGAFVGRAGAAAVMIGGSGAIYPAGAIYAWGGLYADDIGLFGAEYSLDNLNSTLPAAVNPPQALFRIAYAVMPYMNYIVQVSGPTRRRPPGPLTPAHSCPSPAHTALCCALCCCVSGWRSGLWLPDHELPWRQRCGGVVLP